MPTVDPASPEGILRRLYGGLVARRPVIERTAAYYDGHHNLAFAGEKFLEAFGGLFGAFADNWCGIVADAVAERMEVQGFRVNEDPKADDGAKKLWEDNELDLQSAMGILDGLVQGAFYVTVWPRGEGAEAQVPEITVESAMSAIVESHPKIRHRRLNGLRTWLADDGYEHAELFVGKDEVYLWRSKSKRSGVVDPARGQWVVEDQIDARSELDASGKMANPLGRVPIVEFLNMPRLYVSRRVGWAAHSEIAKIIPLQDAANKLLADMLIASEFGAYPQRTLTGYEPDTDPTSGLAIAPEFQSGPGKLWWTENVDAKFGTFDATSLDAYVKAIGMVVQHIASISRTPAHYLSASADRLSGESLKSGETGLVAKVYTRQRVQGAGWEEVMRLAGTVAGNSALAQAQSMSTIWKDPETRTESEHIDAISKKQALNVPDLQLWEEMGYDPDLIKRFPAMRAESDIAGMAARVTAERDRQAATAEVARAGLTTAGAAAVA